MSAIEVASFVYRSSSVITDQSRIRPENQIASTALTPSHRTTSAAVATTCGRSLTAGSYPVAETASGVTWSS